MAEECSTRALHSVVWGRDDGGNVICYAAGTEAEAKRCRDLLRELRNFGDDDRFTYLVRELTDMRSMPRRSSVWKTGKRIPRSWTA